MIFDSLKNSALYYPVSPRLEKAEFNLQMQQNSD